MAGEGEPARPAAVGVLLAAGGGRRMGTPKALLHDADGSSWLRRAVAALRAGGCDQVVVVLGAAADQAHALLSGDPPDRIVVAEDWAGGIGASLRAGLQAAAGTGAAAALVTLVDLPDVGSDVHARLLARWGDGGGSPAALLRAAYGGRPGHPVLLGRAHWAELLRTAAGDRGAGPYLSGRTVLEVSCDDLATGRDADRPEDLEASR